MRVVMLSWEYPPRIVGGISPHVYELSQKLQAKGVADKAAGSAKEAVGKAKDAVHKATK